MTAIDDLNAAAAAINAAATRFQNLANALEASYAPLAGNFNFLAPISTAGLKTSTRTLQSSASMLSTDFGGSIGLTGSTANQTLTLLPALAGAGKVSIFNYATKRWTVACADGQFTMGNPSWPTTLLLDPGESVILHRIGSTWFIVGGSKFKMSKWFSFQGNPASIPNAAETILSGWSGGVVYGGAFTGTLNPTTGWFTAGPGEAGLWLFLAQANTNGSSTREAISIYKNSVNRIGWDCRVAPAPSTDLDCGAFAIADLAEGDWITATYYQNSGSAAAMGNNVTNRVFGLYLGPGA